MAKGLAILLLLAYHLFDSKETIVSMGVNHAPFSLEGFLRLSSFGNICVSIFVFLTSFGISRGLLTQKETFGKEGFWRISYGQAVGRYLRLTLNFAILYLSVNLLWWHKFDYQSLYGAGDQGVLLMLTDALGLSMFFGTPTLNATWWYMELAYLLIFLIPLLVRLVEKIGYPLLLLAFLLPSALTIQPDLRRYFFVAVFGACAAWGNWPDRLLELKLHPILRWLAVAFGFVLCVLIRQNYMVHEHYVHLIDAPMSLFLVYAAAGVAGAVPLLGKALAFLGKHSMNIYLVHTFFYMMLWRQYIYRFQYAGITFLLLLAVCLLYSVLLEAIKKLTRVNRLLSCLNGASPGKESP